MSIPGTATKDPLALCDCIRVKFLDVMESCHQQGVDLVIIETMRDLERQKYYVANKVSKTLKSKHLPQPPKQKSIAFDAVPKRCLPLKNWGVIGNKPHPDWLVYTAAGRKAGLECGADWAGENQGWDWPHCELPYCQCPKK